MSSILIVTLWPFLCMFTFDATQEKEKRTEIGSALTEQQMKDVLNFHNKARKEVGVAALKWSPKLAKDAQKWADELAKSGKFEHGSNNENLAAGNGGGYTLISGIESWYKEKSLYTPGTKIDATNFRGFGHYTAMVWKGTSEVGVGMAVGQAGSMKGWLIIVARYNPPGNVIGKAPY